ncbi:ATP-binding protein [Tidjanibacter massiliensis]|uniref:ATP-binding protein n=1 Tax=Tidjanibacter massiliensis TaxID=1871003 RepID=UPI0008F885AD|nr:ATP-binding protein [Tidjanibacter massiliensis]
MSDKLTFKTNIQLKSIIGKDLINDDNIAILELVKNAFDANAKKVTITYSHLKSNDDNVTATYSDNTSRLIIQDDGIGMSMNDIKNKWLNIAYSEKKSRTRQYNRLMAGAKGVGRFSCDRLGQYLNLYTKQKGSPKYILLQIDWKDFEVEDQNKEIQSVPLSIFHLTSEDLRNRGISPFEKDQGTCLEIIHLRSLWTNQESSGVWNTDKLVKLKKYLEKLINPNQAFEAQNDFGIFLNASEFSVENKNLPKNEQFIGRIQNRIFEKLDFKTTSIECRTINEGTLIYTELKDRGETIFSIKEKNNYFPWVKQAKLTLYYLNPYSKAFFTKQTGIRSIDYGSVFLFINGFRIPPFGDIDNDWLNLNQRKTQGTSRYIGVREIVGNIEILDTDNDFQIISSREGIVRNENFLKLTNSKGNDSFIFKALRRLERYVVEGIDWDRLPKQLDESYNQIEKKILSGEFTENDVIYYEDDRIKRQRIYASIHGIISARPEDVEALYINENLILDKIEEEKQKSEREIEQLLHDFETKKIDINTINRILSHKAEQSKELEKQLKEFAKYETTPATAKAILELQQYKETIKRQEKIIEGLRAELEELQQKQAVAQIENQQLQKLHLEAERKVAQIEKERKETEQKLYIEQTKNKYLASTRAMSSDEESFHHLINNYSQQADTALVKISRIANNYALPKELLEAIDNLSLYVGKINKLTALLCKSDIKTLSENVYIDIPAYVQEYLTDYANTTQRIKITFGENNVILKRNISMLDISIILDNLIINSLKAGASELFVKFSKNEIANKVYIDFSDNGDGVQEPMLSNPQAMFEAGVTTRSGGSGIGLSSVKNLMVNTLFGDIEFIGNGLNTLKGATFRLIF